MLEENTSGHGDYSIVPAEIKKWNWGAFWLTGLWGLFNRTYIALLILVPIINIAVPFYLGAKGNELAWRNKSWSSVEEFKAEAKLWNIIGWVFGIILILITTYGMLKDYKYDKLNDSITKQVIEIVLESEEVRAYISEDYRILFEPAIQRVEGVGISQPVSHLILIESNKEIIFINTSLDENYRIRSISFTPPGSDTRIYIK